MGRGGSWLSVSCSFVFVAHRDYLFGFSAILAPFLRVVFVFFCVGFVLRIVSCIYHV